jgi:chemotaxis protein methyltransferase CheR
VTVDDDCAGFLRWALPQLELRWAGFRKPRRQVCRKVRRRAEALGLDGLDAYRRRLEEDPAEWAVLDGLCRVTISRLVRDRGVWALLRSEVLPALAQRAQGRGASALRAWSAGCASGEEPYSLVLCWRLGLAEAPPVDLDVVATDADPALLERARRGVYTAGSLKEVPAAWREVAFEPAPAEGGQAAWTLRSAYRDQVRSRCQDVRREAPDGPFDLILCRNLAFTYFAPAVQVSTLNRLAARLVEGGALVLGQHEALPGGEAGAAFEPWTRGRPVFRLRPR